MQPKPYLHSSLCLKGQSGYFLQRSPSLQSFKGIFCGLRAVGAGYGAGGTGGAVGGWWEERWPLEYLLNLDPFLHSSYLGPSMCILLHVSLLNLQFIPSEQIIDYI